MTVVLQGIRMKGYLRVSEVAKRLGITPRTIIRMAHKGDLPGAIKKNPFAQTSPILIPETSVEAFLKKRDKGIAETNGKET